jgi:2-methylisocitrate lyase-like PEP mutase family enzyme
MIAPAQAERAARFAALHRSGAFLLPNAWDAPSAALIAEAGYPAIATTSSGVAFTFGLVDGEKIDKGRMLSVVAEIARRSPVPVTTDLEAGYGAEPEAVAAAVRDAIAAGAVGCNIEDTDPQTRKLFDFDLAVARIAAGVQAAKAAGLPDFVLNARTDPYLRAFGDAEACFAEATRRAQAYAAAGARSLFVPGPADPDVIRALVAAIPGPVNILSRPDLPSFETLKGLGVRRVSLGGSLAGSAYGHAKRVLADLKARGDFAAAGGGLTHADMMALVSGFGAPTA